MSDEAKNVKVTDQETRRWMESLGEADRIELKRRALEKRAVELLQPEPEAPNFAGMSDAEFNAWKARNGCV